MGTTVQFIKSEDLRLNEREARSLTAGAPAEVVLEPGGHVPAEIPADIKKK